MCPSTVLSRAHLVPFCAKLATLLPLVPSSLYFFTPYRWNAIRDGQIDGHLLCCRSPHGNDPSPSSLRTKAREKQTREDDSLRKISVSVATTFANIFVSKLFLFLRESYFLCRMLRKACNLKNYIRILKENTQVCA